MNKLIEVLLIGILFPLIISITLYELNWIDKKNEKRIEYQQKIVNNLKEIKNIIEKEKWKIKYKGIIEKPLDNSELHTKIEECFTNEKYYNIYINQDEKVEFIKDIVIELESILRQYDFDSWVDFEMKNKIIRNYDNNLENNKILRENINEIYHKLSIKINNAEKIYFRKIDEFVNSNSIERFLRDFT